MVHKILWYYRSRVYFDISVTQRLRQSFMILRERVLHSYHRKTVYIVWSWLILAKSKFVLDEEVFPKRRSFFGVFAHSVSRLGIVEMVLTSFFDHGVKLVEIGHPVVGRRVHGSPLHKGNNMQLPAAFHEFKESSVSHFWWHFYYTDDQRIDCHLIIFILLRLDQLLYLPYEFVPVVDEHLYLTLTCYDQILKLHLYFKDVFKCYNYAVEQ